MKNVCVCESMCCPTHVHMYFHTQKKEFEHHFFKEKTVVLWDNVDSFFSLAHYSFYWFCFLLFFFLGFVSTQYASLHRVVLMINFDGNTQFHSSNLTLMPKYAFAFTLAAYLHSKNEADFVCRWSWSVDFIDSSIAWCILCSWRNWKLF